MEREEIIRKIHENEILLKELGAEKLFLFGSAVHNDLERPVDLVMESALKPRIRKKVQGEMVRVA
jgi:hypothetical protein